MLLSAKYPHSGGPDYELYSIETKRVEGVRTNILLIGRKGGQSVVAIIPDIGML
jgi:hypothetical protein